MVKIHDAEVPTLSCVFAQVNKSTKQAQQRKAKAAPSYVDDSNAAADAPKRWSDYSVHFEFPEPTELPPPLIQLNDVSFKYPGRDDFGLKDLNIGVDMGSRVAIVGPNGAGKTTLMNLLSGAVSLGTMHMHGLKLGWQEKMCSILGALLEWAVA